MNGVKILKGSSRDLFQGSITTFDLRDFRKPKTAVRIASYSDCAILAPRIAGCPAKHLKCILYVLKTQF
jgi:hypothetical protein